MNDYLVNSKKYNLESNIKDKKTKRAVIEYGIIAVVAIVLYLTGLHTEVIGFVQRGVLATGLLNPNLEKIIEKRDNSQANKEVSFPKADYNLRLIDKNGKVSSLQDLKGKVIFLNFWATWCAPCIAEMPSIAKLHKDLGDEVAFVILSVDEDFETAKAFNNRKKYDFPIYSPLNEVPSVYNSTSIPTTYIIDAKGNLVMTHEGMADYNSEKFKKFLRSLK